MHRRENFTAYEVMPEDLYIYLSHNGPHFTKELCDFATAQMFKLDNKGEEHEIESFEKDQISNILKTYNIKLKNAQLYDPVYVANMCKADYLGSSIITEEQLAMYIKDTLEDPDAIEGLIFNRWIADMKWLGIAIPWDEFI